MKKLAVLVVGLVPIVVVAVAFGAGSTSFKVAATLKVGGEVPRAHASARAGGAFTGTVRRNGTVRTLRWRLTFAHLSGFGVAAHVHKGRVGKAGPVLVSLCAPCHLGQTGIVRVTAATAKAMASGSTYVNVHTKKNKGGEIRGQVKVVG